MFSVFRTNNRDNRERQRDPPSDGASNERGLTTNQATRSERSVDRPSEGDGAIDGTAARSRRRARDDLRLPSAGLVDRATARPTKTTARDRWSGRFTVRHTYNCYYFFALRH